MKIVAKPKPEDKVVASVRKGAKAQSIYKSMLTRAESCVDHLCGCSSCNHSGC
jgi:hypothetical protein